MMGATPQWAYVTYISSLRKSRSVGLRFLYLALQGAYNNGDLDIVCELTEFIKERIDNETN